MTKPATRKPESTNPPVPQVEGDGRRPKAANQDTAVAAASPLVRAASAVEQAAPDIVEALIEQAKQGSYLHAKFLFDFAGLSPPPIETGEDSLASRLLRVLEIEECRPRTMELPSRASREWKPGTK